MEPLDPREEKIERLAALASTFPMTIVEFAKTQELMTHDDDMLSVVVAGHAGMAVRWAALMLSEAAGEVDAIEKLKSPAEMIQHTVGFAPGAEPGLLEAIELMQLDPETGREIGTLTARADIAGQLLRDGSRWRLVRNTDVLAIPGEVLPDRFRGQRIETGGESYVVVPPRAPDGSPYIDPRQEEAAIMDGEGDPAQLDLARIGALRPTTSVRVQTFDVGTARAGEPFTTTVSEARKMIRGGGYRLVHRSNPIVLRGVEPRSEDEPNPRTEGRNWGAALD